GAAPRLRFTALLDDQGCLCVAGWRVMETTTVIRKIYVDDLVTARAARSQGCGARMLQHIEQRARELGITRIELDSGVQRHAAHRFYLRQHYDIVSHHFARTLA
ncbi:MAG: GNAT family N-acetyltransferase, partial [Actinomyces bowdenii]|nr:GNAT family N-acetyltransferase [Actinomyces bowdenii]